MNYFVIDNFISEDNCRELIKDTPKLNGDNYIKTHKGTRMMLTSSSLNFKNLLASSENWRKLDEKISSNSFLEMILKKLSINKNFHLTNFFSDYSTANKNHASFKNLGLLQLNNVNILSLTKYLIYKIFRSIYRFFKFNLINLIKDQPIELLYDFSKATNGYENQIHRDTDSRVLIILIYLKYLEDDSKGGNLKIYKNTIKTNDYYPDQKNLELIEEIKPKPGRLVVMMNDNNFFHSTDKLSNLAGTRDFIYGGYTALSGVNPFLKDNKKHKTAFFLYD